MFLVEKKLTALINSSEHALKSKHKEKKYLTRLIRRSDVKD